MAKFKFLLCAVFLLLFSSLGQLYAQWGLGVGGAYAFNDMESVSKSVSSQSLRGLNYGLSAEAYYQNLSLGGQAFVSFYNESSQPYSLGASRDVPMLSADVLIYSDIYFAGYPRDLLAAFFELGVGSSSKYGLDSSIFTADVTQPLLQYTYLQLGIGAALNFDVMGISLKLLYDLPGATVPNLLALKEYDSSLANFSEENKAQLSSANAVQRIKLFFGITFFFD